MRVPVLLATLLLLLPGCRTSPTPPEQPAGWQRANLLLISIDTLRADRLGCYGYPRPTSPAIDSLAARGARFSRAVAESSWTLPSHWTLLTGLHPTTHGVTLPQMALPEQIPTLAELLSGAGYRSYAWTDGGFVGERHGFSRGFESWDERREGLASAIPELLASLEQHPADQPWFVFLHSYDVHCPYHPSERWAAEFRTRPEQDWLETEDRCGNPHFNSLELTPGQVQFLSDQYDAGIRETDELLAGLFAWLDQRDAWRDTVVVLLSDHGEELWEHGQIGHERTLYRESLLVPLIIAAPELPPRVVELAAGLADVAPTLLSMLGVEPPAMQGLSLVPWMTGVAGAQAPRALYSELDRHVVLRSVMQAEHHLIYDVAASDDRLYDVVTDPRENISLVASRPELAQRMRQLLADHLGSLSRPPAMPNVLISPEQEEQLRALGYLQ